MSQRKGSGLPALSLLAVVCVSAPAGTIFISDLTEGTPTITASGGAGISLVCQSPVPPLEQCTFSLAEPSGTVFVDNLDPSGVNIFEPGGAIISDLLQVLDHIGDFWQFNSDVEGGPPLPALNRGFPTNITEDGTAQTAATINFLDGNRVIIGTDVIQIQSDVDAPETSTWLMVLFGLLLVGGRRVAFNWSKRTRKYS